MESAEAESTSAELVTELFSCVETECSCDGVISRLKALYAEEFGAEAVELDNGDFFTPWLSLQVLRQLHKLYGDLKCILEDDPAFTPQVHHMGDEIKRRFFCIIS